MMGSPTADQVHVPSAIGKKKRTVAVASKKMGGKVPLVGGKSPPKPKQGKVPPKSKPFKKANR